MNYEAFQINLYYCLHEPDQRGKLNHFLSSLKSMPAVRVRTTKSNANLDTYTRTHERKEDAMHSCYETEKVK